MFPAALAGQRTPPRVRPPAPNVDRQLVAAGVWAEARYNYAYWDAVRANWDSAFAATVTYVDTTPRPTDLQFARRLRRWGALLNDGQLEILPPAPRSSRVARASPLHWTGGGAVLSADGRRRGGFPRRVSRRQSRSAHRRSVRRQHGTDGAGVSPCGLAITRDAAPDGKEFMRAGIMPDIAVVTRIEDLLAGRDAVLERARAYLVELTRR